MFILMSLSMPKGERKRERPTWFNKLQHADLIRWIIVPCTGMNILKKNKKKSKLFPFVFHLCYMPQCDKTSWGQLTSQ